MVYGVYRGILTETVNASGYSYRKHQRVWTTCLNPMEHRVIYIAEYMASRMECKHLKGPAPCPDFNILSSVQRLLHHPVSSPAFDVLSKVQ